MKTVLKVCVVAVAALSIGSLCAMEKSKKPMDWKQYWKVKFNPPRNGNGKRSGKRSTPRKRNQGRRGRKVQGSCRNGSCRK